MCRIWVCLCPALRTLQGEGEWGWEQEGRAVWAGERGPGMTSSVSHPASALAGESQGGVYGFVSHSRVEPTTRRSGGGSPPQAQAWRSGYGRFTKLRVGGRRAVGFEGGPAVHP